MTSFDVEGHFGEQKPAETVLNVDLLAELGSWRMGFRLDFSLPGGQLVGGGLRPASRPVSLLFRLASPSPLVQASAPDLSSQNSQL